MKNSPKILDDLDLFLINAHWSYEKYDSYFEKRSEVLLEFIEIVNSKGINYSIKSVKSNDEKLFLNKREFDKIYFYKKETFSSLIKNLSKENFITAISEKNINLILKQNIVIEIHDIKSLNKKLVNTRYVLKNKKVNVVYEDNFNFNKFIKIKSKISKFIKKIYYRIRVIGLYNSLNYSQDNVYKLTYNNFRNLQFEPKNSINWLLRKNHLYLLSDNKKYFSIKSIVSHLRKNDNLTKKLKKIVEVDTREVFDEPIHLNRNFWESGNNFFIYSAYFEFRKNVVPYKGSNNYIESNPSTMLYSYEYYENLDKMNDNEIREFLINNPIEITNRHITSGRHRVAAMIGRLAKNKPYINFYVKLND
jgi:hypothetical protein